MIPLILTSVWMWTLILERWQGTFQRPLSQTEKGCRTYAGAVGCMEIVTCDEVLATSANVLGVLCRFVATTGKKQVKPDRLNVKKRPTSQVRYPVALGNTTQKIRRWSKYEPAPYLLSEII